MAGIVNFYEELGIGRDDTVSQIRETLTSLKFQLTSKVARPSSQRDSWMRQLELIGDAEKVFWDEDSKERYDIELSRSATPDAPAVDWTTRAWNYYFADDIDAALIAARRAKEQSPGEPMSFVVSAWVSLREGEANQAKRDADEAFVLGELTMDSVDVHEVRGAVYAALGQHGRALTSFDRALAKATVSEKAELYWRKAIVYEAMGQSVHAYESACAGLSQGVPLSMVFRRRLETSAAEAMHSMDNVAVVSESVRQYQRRRHEVLSSAIDDESKNRILINIDQNIARCEKALYLQERCVVVEGAIPSEPREPASSSGKNLGCLPIACFTVLTLLAFAMNFLVGIFILLISLACLAVYVVSERNSARGREQAKAKYDDIKAERAARQLELKNLQLELREMLRGPLPLQSSPEQ